MRWMPRSPNAVVGPKDIGNLVQQLEDFLVKLNEKLDFFANAPRSVRWDNIKTFPDDVPANKL